MPKQHLAAYLTRALYTGLAAGIGVFIALSMRPAAWDASVAMAVSSAETQAEEYGYDGYYALQAEELFAKAIADIMRAPEFAADVAACSGEGGGVPIRALRRRITVRLNGAAIEAQFSARDKETAQKTALCLGGAVDERAAAKMQGAPYRFKVQKWEPAISEREENRLAYFGTALAAAFLLSLSLSMAIGNFRERSQE